MENNTVVITRHKTLVEWLNREGINTDVVIEQATPEDVAGKDVIGVLPMWLAELTNTYSEVSMPGLTLETRKRMNGGDFSIDEMDDWGAELKLYAVFNGFVAQDCYEFGKSTVENAEYVGIRL